MVDGSFASPSTTSKPLNGTAIITSPLCVNTSVGTQCDYGDSDHAMTTKTCVSLDRRAPSFFLVLAILGNSEGLVAISKQPNGCVVLRSARSFIARIR